MSKFKVGDRVAVYGTDHNLNPIRGISVITEILNDGKIAYIETNASVFSKGRDLTMPHIKQLRKLKNQCKCTCERHK